MAVLCTFPGDDPLKRLFQVESVIDDGKTRETVLKEYPLSGSARDYQTGQEVSAPALPEDDGPDLEPCAPSHTLRDLRRGHGDD